MSTQVTSPVTSTGYYPWQVEVKASFSNRGDVDRILTGNVGVVVNGMSNPFGPGWSLSALDSLVSVTGGMLWVSGDHGSRFFASAGGSSYTSPANDFGALVKN